MPVTINGDGSITGFVAQTANIANGAIGTNQLANGAVTNVKHGAGSVIQVKQAETSSQITSSSGDFDIVTVSLTPTATGNKIFIFGTVMGIQSGGYNNIRIKFTVKRDSTSLMASDANHWYHGSTQTVRDGGFSINYVDTAPGTSSYTYKLVGTWVDTSGTNAYVNKDNNSGSSTITVMEVAA